jgi:hypothetical protein
MMATTGSRYVTCAAAVHPLRGDARLSRGAYARRTATGEGESGCAADLLAANACAWPTEHDPARWMVSGGGDLVACQRAQGLETVVDLEA